MNNVPPIFLDFGGRKVNIRNRMNDVEKLRCNACQDFLKMIIIKNWQNELYTLASSNKDEMVYRAVYQKMRASGIEQYSVDDMDVTTIFEIVKGCSIIKQRVDNRTFTALRNVKEDRNTTGHSSKNEPDADLYLDALISLKNLKAFIETVDSSELTIDDSERKAFLQKYTRSINELQSLIDDERIEIIKRERDIDKSVQSILDSEDPLKQWVQVCDYYNKRSRLEEDGRELMNEFFIRASDAGIKNAHILAANIFLTIKNKHNIGEVEKRLAMAVNSSAELEYRDAKEIISVVNDYLAMKKTRVITEEMEKTIQVLIKHGFCVEKDDDGFYEIKKN